MKKTYAYVKYVAPKLNRHGSFDAADAHVVCLGVTLNATEKDRHHYKQAEISYPDEMYRIREQGGRRDLVTQDREDPQDLNALLEANVITGRIFKSAAGTVAFTCLADLTGGRAIPPEAEPEPPRCPHCGGRITVTACVDYADQRRSGVQEIACATCQGTGTITPELAQRLEDGKALAQSRKERDLSLREEAQRLGISVRELSDLEHGRLRAEGEVTHIR